MSPIEFSGWRLNPHHISRLYYQKGVGEDALYDVTLVMADGGRLQDQIDQAALDRLLAVFDAHDAR